MKTLKDLVIEILRDKCGVKQNEDGTLSDEIYAYVPLTEAKAREICMDKDPKALFCATLFAQYYGAGYTSILQLRDKVLQHLHESLGNHDLEQEVLQIVSDIAGLALPYKEHLQQDFPVTIMLDLGGKHSTPSYDKYSRYLMEDSSLMWLAKQQGYTREQLKKAIRVYGAADDDDEEDIGPDALEDPFLRSCAEEVYGSDGMSVVTFLVRMELGDVIWLNEAMRQKKNGSVMLDSETQAGLFDIYDGGRAPFEIHLAKNVEIPIRHIYSALPDCPHSYGVRKACNFKESIWGDNLISINVKED